MKTLTVLMMFLFIGPFTYGEEPQMEAELKVLLGHFEPLMKGEEAVMENASVVANKDQPGDTKIHDGRRVVNERPGRRPAIMDAGDDPMGVSSK